MTESERMQVDCAPPPGFVWSTWEADAKAAAAAEEEAKAAAEAAARAAAKAAAEAEAEVAAKAKADAEAVAKAEADKVEAAKAAAEAEAKAAAQAKAAAATEAFATEAAATEVPPGTEDDECVTPAGAAEASSGDGSASELQTGNSADFYNSGHVGPDITLPKSERTFDTPITTSMRRRCAPTR